MIDKMMSNELVDVVVNSGHENEKNGYVKPLLTCFGDVRDITLGGSIPGGESLGNCIVGLEPGCNP